MKIYNEYEPNRNYNLIDCYEFPDDVDDWKECPKCQGKPKIWVFNNGVFAACKCGNGKYDNFNVRVESIMSVYSRTKRTAEYQGEDALRDAWNGYCENGYYEKLPEGRW